MTAGSVPEEEDRMPVRRLPLILMYHSVGIVSHDPNLLCVTPDRFAAQMSWLRRHGLRGVSVSALMAAHRAGRAGRLVGLTFDDGYAAIADSAIPVLHEHGFTATVFVLPGRLGGVNDWDDGTPWPLLTRPQITGLAAAGMEIGSHTATHAALADAGPEVLDAEVAGSRDTLASLTGQPVRGFAYPYGSVGRQARDAVRHAGYDYACAVGPAGPPGRYALPRIYAGQADGPARLAAKRLLYRAYFSRDYYRDNLAAKGTHQ
jgi:peptidoglycan/xylan/chitin deacetylase (PgdA/CDA1 family)